MIDPRGIEIEVDRLEDGSYTVTASTLVRLMTVITDSEYDRLGRDKLIADTKQKNRVAVVNAIYGDVYHLLRNAHFVLTTTSNVLGHSGIALRGDVDQVLGQVVNMIKKIDALKEPTGGQ